MEKKWPVTALHLQSIKTFWTLKLSQYCRSGSTIPSSEPVPASSDCSRIGNTGTLFLCSPVWTVQAVQECCPKSLTIASAVKNFNCLLESGLAFGSDCQIKMLNLDSTWNLKFAAWPTGCKGFICSEITE